MRNRNYSSNNQSRSRNFNQPRRSQSQSDFHYPNRDELSRDPHRSQDYADNYKDNFQYEDDSRRATSSRGVPYDDYENRYPESRPTRSDYYPEDSGFRRQNFGHSEREFPESNREAYSHRGKGPKGYNRTDERIREDICERLTDHPEIDASEVEIEVKDGKVTFSGVVTDKWMKYNAEDLAEQISGVKEVKNDIRVMRDYNRRDGGLESPSSRKEVKTSKLN